MKKSRKVLSLLLAVILVFPSIVCVATVSASATESVSIDDVDYYGNNICEIMEDYLTRWARNYFDGEIQGSRDNGTVVFVDYQLIEYGLIDHLCQALNNSNVFPTTLYWGNIREETGITFLVDCGEYFYMDLELWVANGIQAGYDFSIPEYYEYLCNCIGVNNMCALGVWYPGNEHYQFIKHIQNLWDDNFPIYYIYRDPITLGEDGLLFQTYDSTEGIFYYCYDAPGATY